MTRIGCVVLSIMLLLGSGCASDSSWSTSQSKAILIQSKDSVVVVARTGEDGEKWDESDIPVAKHKQKKPLSEAKKEEKSEPRSEPRVIVARTDDQNEPKQKKIVQGLQPDDFKNYDPKEYTVSVGDVLEVSIFGHGEILSDSIPVAPDGNLYFHFFDGIPAAGRTPDALAREIESKIRHLFASPEVSIIPRGVTSSSYVILGKVKEPGEYTIDSSVTVRQAIGAAGGFRWGGYRGTSINVTSLENSFIVRDGEKLPIDFKKLMNEEDEDQDIYVREGDYIYVASGLRHKVYRMGAVPEQRAMTWEDGMTLVGLITGYAGLDSGYFRNAYIKKVIILRGSLEKPKVIPVNLKRVLEGKANDVYLLPGDIVYVPEKQPKFLGALVKKAILAFVSGFSWSAGEHYMEEHIFDED